MDPQQAVSMGRHISILQKRIDNLEKELKRVQGEKNNVETAIRVWKNYRNNQDHEYSQRMLDIDVRYKKETDEVKKQIKLVRTLVFKRQEEKASLICLLKQTNLIDEIDDDIDEINWTKLKDMASKAKHMKNPVILNKRTRIFDDLLTRFRGNMSDLLTLKDSVLEIKNQFDKKHLQFKNCNLSAANNNTEKDKQIDKYKSENERLNLLIRQCAMSDEPMNNFVSDNIRAKCHSFLDTDNHDDLLQGLRKFQARQSRMIKLMKFMECRHIRDCNLLQVALDETTDHTKYYTNLRHQINTRTDIDFALNSDIYQENFSP